MIGRTLSHYRITALLGEGGMGTVYRATDSILRREVALKVIHPDRAGDREARVRFLRERRAAASIDHPNIATIHDAGESDDGTLYFVSELVEGETLQNRLARGPIPLAEAVGLGSQLAQALAAAHAGGIVHRDIKPSNIAITMDGRLKVLDFGLARPVAGAPNPGAETETTVTGAITQAHVIMGTPAYMSPEQAAGVDVDERTDVFSGAAVIYEMISGRAAFGAPTVQEVLHRVLSVDPEPLDADMPSDLAQVLTRALAKDPSHRLSSCRELAAALRSVEVKLEQGPAPPGGRRAAGSRRRVVAGAAALAVVAAVALALWLRGRATLPFVGHDTLLVADVDNQTGDPIFDVALKSAIEADLQQSRFANVFERARVTETLQFMRRDPAARITEELGRDICRHARLKALLLPRILAAGDVFDLSVLLIEPSTGRTVNRVRVTVRGREDVLLQAVDKVTREVRTLLGESLDSIATNDLRIAQATTASWEALRDLSLGQRRWAEARYQDAAALFDRALEEDPHFMAAMGSLGLLLIQFLGQAERGRQLLRQALAESDSVTMRERLMIRALNEQFVDRDPAAALQQYRLISDVYPDLPQPYNNSGYILRSLGRPEEAAAMFETAAQAAPGWSIPLSNLYWTYLQTLRRPAAAESVAVRLVALDSLSVYAIGLLAWSQLPQGRLADAERGIRRALRINPKDVYARPNLAHLLLATGRAGEALPLYRQIAQASTPGRDDYVVSYLHLSLALQATGATAEAQRSLEELERRVATQPTGRSPSAGRRIELAMLAAARGQASRALRLVQKEIAQPQADPTICYRLSQVHALLGRREDGIEYLRRALDAGYPDRYFPMLAPELAPLRSLPAFGDLYPECPRAGLLRGDDGGASPGSPTTE